MKDLATHGFGWRHDPNAQQGTDPPAADPAAAMARAIMKKADRGKHNNALTVNEMRTYLGHTEHEPFLQWLTGANKAKVTGRRLPIFDKDHDGELSMQELEDAVRAFLQETAATATKQQQQRVKKATSHTAAGSRQGKQRQHRQHSDVVSLRTKLHRHHVTTGQLFACMDADRSDTITFSEFKRGVAMAGVRPIPADDHMQMLFDSLDRDSNGRIDYAELRDMLASPVGGSSSKDAENTGRASVCRVLPLLLTIIVYHCCLSSLLLPFTSRPPCTGTAAIAFELQETLNIAAAAGTPSAALDRVGHFAAAPTAQAHPEATGHLRGRS